jgi:hypothetical protein
MEYQLFFLVLSWLAGSIMRISYCIVLAEKKEIKIQSTIPAKCVILFLYYPEVKNPKSNYPNSQTASV